MARDCIFCRIASGEAQAYWVYRGHGVMVILDKYPVRKGHLLVMPEQHHEAVQDTPPATLARVWLVASAIARIYREKLGAPGLRIVTNSGAIAGQVIFHFHVHVIPYYEKRDRMEVTEDEAREVVEMLKPHLGLVEEYLRGAGLVGEDEA